MTEHFSLEELIASETAERKGINNTPPEELLPNLHVLAEGLERVRAILGGYPVHVNSGYRSAQLNRFVGGARSSFHMQGLAADIICPRFGVPLELCRAIDGSGLAVNQIIHEFGRWCHVAFPAPGSRTRNQLLTIASTARGYQAGLNPVG